MRGALQAGQARMRDAARHGTAGRAGVRTGVNP
jgi:hypothetical protein